MKKTIVLSCIAIAMVTVSCEENLKKAEEALQETSLDSVTNENSQNLESNLEEYKDSANQAEIDTQSVDVETPTEEAKKLNKLKAYNFKTEGLRMKINNTPEPTTKARNCVQVRSTFIIGENADAEPRNRTVYLQITNPDGNILLSRSGDAFRDIDGKEILYSDKRDIEYSNQAVDVSVYYDFNGEEPLKGTYKVKIFCDGYIIGSDSFALK